MKPPIAAAVLSITFVAVLGLAACAWLGGGRPVRGAVGAGWTVRLSKADGGAVTEAEADAVIVEVRRELRGDGARFVAEELERRFDEGLADEVVAGDEAKQEVAALRLDEVQWRLNAEGPVDDMILQGRRSYVDGMSGEPGTHALGDGKRLDIGVAIDVVPWPRRENFTPHPEVVLCHAELSWWTCEGALIGVPRVLADDLALRLCRRAAAIAERQGFVVGLRGPDGDTATGADGELVPAEGR